MKFILTLAILLVATISIYSQPQQATQCAVKLGQSPAVRGIKLGMKLEDVLALFPVGEDSNYEKDTIAKRNSFPHYGVIGYWATTARSKVKDQFAGIESVGFVFLDDRVVQYEVLYEWPPWPQLDDFVGKLANTFHLPPASAWLNDGPTRKRLACHGFNIQAVTRDGRAVLTVRTAGEPSAVQRERRAASEAQARRDFRP